MIMKPSYKDLLTIYYNSVIVPKYEWMDGIIVDRLEIVDGLAKGKIRVITNFDTIKGMSPLEFYEKTGGVRGSEITNLLSPFISVVVVPNSTSSSSISL